MAFLPPPCYLPVYKPTLPYHHLLPDGLQAGTSVYVQGVVSQDAKSFWVNFASDQQEGANIPLRFNPHFDGNEKIVLNTFQDGKWEVEEQHEMPFQKGKQFEIIFTVNDEEYQILLNKNPFFSYKHRMPPQSVKVVSVDGDLELQSLAVIENPKTLRLSTNFHPPVPFTGNIPGGLKPKMNFIIRGFIPEKAHRVAIDFMAGPDIALHINPRLEEGTVVRNSLLKGSWGTEELEVPFNPFQRGKYFELSIRCGKNQFTVYANDEYFFSFTHRYIHLPQVNTLLISKDVILTYVQY